MTSSKGFIDDKDIGVKQGFNILVEYLAKVKKDPINIKEEEQDLVDRLIPKLRKYAKSYEAVRKDLSNKQKDTVWESLE